MKVYEYSEVRGYNNVDEIMREKTIVFGSINEGKIIKIFYKNSLCSRDIFEINISYCSRAYTTESGLIPGTLILIIWGIEYSLLLIITPGSDLSLLIKYPNKVCTIF